MNALIIPLVRGGLVAAIACPCVPAAHAQETAQRLPDVSRVRVTWDERPSIHLGRMARVDLRVTLQADARRSTVFEPDDPQLSWAKRRVGIGGVVAGTFGFQIEREVGGPWRDVYVNYQQFDAVQVRAGQFKLPFSRDETTSLAHLDFVYRSRAAEVLAPGRDRGLMAHGRVFDNTLGYEVGVFEHDGNQGRRPGDGRVYGGQSVAARITVRPFRSLGSAARTVEVGAAGVWTEVPEGLTSLQGVTSVGQDFYEPELWVQGPQRRQGLELRWRPGPCSVNAEYMRLTAERRHQSVEDADLSPFLSTGWYVSGTWAITGERKADGPENPRRPLPHGPGAIEAAVRVEALGFSSTFQDDLPSTSPRADSVLGNRLRAMTLGLNWFPRRWVKLQFNLIRESLDDPTQGPRPGEDVFYARVIRAQFHW